jgi:hypothetical protein
VNRGKPSRVQSEPQVCFGLRWLRAQPHPEFLRESRRLEEVLWFHSGSLRKLRHPIGGLRRIVANPFQTGIEQEVDFDADDAGLFLEPDEERRVLFGPQLQRLAGRQPSYQRPFAGPCPLPLWPLPLCPFALEGRGLRRPGGSEAGE